MSASLYNCYSEQYITQEKAKAYETRVNKKIDKKYSIIGRQAARWQKRYLDKNKVALEHYKRVLLELHTSWEAQSPNIIIID